jgi:hypothetical protein
MDDTDQFPIDPTRVSHASDGASKEMGGGYKGHCLDERVDDKKSGALPLNKKARD